MINRECLCTAVIIGRTLIFFQYFWYLFIDSYINRYMLVFWDYDWNFRWLGTLVCICLLFHESDILVSTLEYSWLVEASKKKRAHHQLSWPNKHHQIMILFSHGKIFVFSNPSLCRWLPAAHDLAAGVPPVPPRVRPPLCRLWCHPLPPAEAVLPHRRDRRFVTDLSPLLMTLSGAVS